MRFLGVTCVIKCLPHFEVFGIIFKCMIRPKAVHLNVICAANDIHVPECSKSTWPIILPVRSMHTVRVRRERKQPVRYVAKSMTFNPNFIPKLLIISQLFFFFRLTTGSLKSHILVQHENIKLEKPKVHICEVCGKGFSAPSLLSQHSLTHIDRQFTQVQCEICGKWIKNRDILRAHKKIHNQVPEKCPHCGKMKQSHEILRKHILVAHSIGKHQCTFCEKSFTRPKALREHIATHTGESLYDCPYCPRKFKNDANKYKHMREKHLTQWNIDRGKKAN